MGIRLKPSRNLTAKDRIAIKKGGHAHLTQLFGAHAQEMVTLLTSNGFRRTGDN